MTKLEEIAELQAQTCYQVQVIPDDSNPYALADKAHVTEAEARAALKDFVLAQVKDGAGFGTDPHAAEFADAVYLDRGDAADLRVRVLARSAWDCLPAAESDQILAAARDEAATDAFAQLQADLATATAELDRFEKATPADDAEEEVLNQLHSEAFARVTALEDQVKQVQREQLRQRILSA